MVQNVREAAFCAESDALSNREALAEASREVHSTGTNDRPNLRIAESANWAGCAWLTRADVTGVTKLPGRYARADKRCTVNPVIATLTRGLPVGNAVRLLCTRWIRASLKVVAQA